MDLGMFVKVYFAILIAELGDKTQIATLCFSATSERRLGVFIGASLALITTSLIATMGGYLLGQYIKPEHLKYFAGILFIGLGIFTILKP